MSWLLGSSHHLWLVESLAETKVSEDHEAANRVNIYIYITPEYIS